MGKFEESLIDFNEAETIRREHALEKFSPHALAFKHALPYRVIQDILYYRIHKPAAPVEEQVTKATHP